MMFISFSAADSDNCFTDISDTLTLQALILDIIIYIMSIGLRSKCIFLPIIKVDYYC